MPQGFLTKGQSNLPKMLLAPMYAAQRTLTVPAVAVSGTETLSSQNKMFQSPGQQQAVATQVAGKPSGEEH